MKTVLVCLALSLSIAFVWSETCQAPADCRDTYCKHDTSLTCEYNLCSCSPPPYDINCKLKGDCDRHDLCNDGWHCILGKCRCGQ